MGKLLLSLVKGSNKFLTLRRLVKRVIPDVVFIQETMVNGESVR